MGQGLLLTYIISNQEYNLPTDTVETKISKPATNFSSTHKEKDTVFQSANSDTAYHRKPILSVTPVVSELKNFGPGSIAPDQVFVPEMPEILPSEPLKNWLVFSEKHNQTSCLTVFISEKAKPALLRNEICRNQFLPDWFFLLFLTGLILLSSARMLYARYFDRVLVALTNEHQSLNVHKSRNLFTSQVLFLLLLNFILITPLAIYILLNGDGASEYNYRLISILGLAGLLAGIVVLKRLLLYLTGNLFKSRLVFAEYYVFVRNFYIKSGLILLPCVLFGAYLRILPSNVFLIAAVAGIIVLYLERLYRGLHVAVRYHVPKFYLFLYLCALEIIPVLIGYKFIRDITGI